MKTTRHFLRKWYKYVWFTEKYSLDGYLCTYFCQNCKESHWHRTKLGGCSAIKRRKEIEQRHDFFSFWLVWSGFSSVNSKFRRLCWSSFLKPRESVTTVTLKIHNLEYWVSSNSYLPFFRLGQQYQFLNQNCEHQNTVNFTVKSQLKRPLDKICHGAKATFWRFDSRPPTP